MDDQHSVDRVLRVGLAAREEREESVFDRDTVV